MTIGSDLNTSVEHPRLDEKWSEIMEPTHSCSIVCVQNDVLRGREVNGRPESCFRYLNGEERNED